MRFWSTGLIAATALLGALASPVDVDLSNAERLQHGLPLKAPARRFTPSVTRNLHPRASGDATSPQVVQVNPLGNSNRKRAAPQYLTYDANQNKVTLGDLEDALNVFIPPEGQIDGPLQVEIGGEVEYMYSTLYDENTDTYSFGLTSATDSGLPIGKTSQTSIWNYASSILSADHFPSTGIKQALTLGVSDDGTLVGATDGKVLPTKLGLGVVSLADAQDAQSERNEWYMKVIDTSNTVPGERYALYSDKYDEFTLVDDKADATVFHLNAAATNASRTVISFEMDGVTQLVGLKETAKQYGAYDSPTVSMIRAGGKTDQNKYLTEPTVTDGWVLRSGLSGYPGMIGHYTWSDGRDADVIFSASSSRISGRALNRYGVGQPAVITFVGA